MRTRASLLLPGFLLLSVTLAAYWQVLSHDFVDYDDPVYVTGNPHVRTGLRAENVAWALTATVVGNWHPATWLSHMLDAELFGLNAGGHHLTSLILHMLNTLLLLVVLVEMTGAVWRSVFVAALFALHPLHVESVAWIAERKDVLSTVFWMLTLWAYVRYVRRPGPRRYCLVVLAFAVGLTAKPMLVTLPFVLLLLDYWPLGRLAPTAQPTSASRAPEGAALTPGGASSRASRVVWEKAPLFVLAAASSALTFVVQRGSGAVRSFGILPLKVRVANVLLAYVTYIRKLFWPRDLACFYPYVVSPAPWRVAGAAALLAAATFAVTRSARRYPYLPVGWFWYLGTLVPVIGVVQVGPQSMADRYTYVPLIGLFIVLSWGATDVLARWRGRALALSLGAGVAVSACVLGTWLQVGHWRDSITLFEHALAVTSNNNIAHVNLGVALAAEGKTDEAITHYAEALRITPEFAEAHTYLGIALAGKGAIAEAVAHYGEALRIEPDDAAAHSNLGAALMKEGQIDEAVAHLSTALRIAPENPVAHNNLGLALRGQGRSEEAMAQYGAALRIDPDYADAHYNLAAVLAEAGRLTEAETHYGAALRSEPDHAAAHNNLGTLLSRQGRVDEALVQYREAIRLAPDYPDPHVNLAAALRRQGKLAEAASHLSEALRIDPDHADAHYVLANVLAQEGELDEAIAQYSAALQVRPDFAEAHNNLGRALAEQRKIDQAMAHYSEALRINPNLAEAYYNRGIGYRQMGESARAEADLERARELDPRSAE